MGIAEILVLLIIGVGVCTAVAWIGFATFERALGGWKNDPAHRLPGTERPAPSDRPNEYEALRRQNRVLRERMAHVERRLPPPPPAAGRTRGTGDLAEMLDREDAYRSTPPPETSDDED